MLRWLQKNKEEGKKSDASSLQEQVVSSVVANTPVKVEKQEGGQSKYTQLGADHFVKYKWLRKRSDGHLVCIVCTQFPEVSKAADVFVKGWVGNANGFKYEAFNRHVQKPYHSRCQEQFENGIGQLKNGFVPEVTAWSLKISESLNEQLAAKVIAENWLSTEHVASDKYETLLDAFEKAKANVGTTHRNRRGFDIFNAVHSDFILKDQKHNFQNLRTFGLGADLGTDKSGRPQECISLRGVDTEKGELIDAALGYSLVRHANAECTLNSLFSKLQEHGISREQAKQKWISLTADGASVTLSMLFSAL